jgi:UDP-N-acetylglucosamine 1-carboxyvinyltransferase
LYLTTFGSNRIYGFNKQIEETIYKDRVAHIYELNKMNAHIDINGSSFIIKGNSKPKGSILVGKDLRGTASLVLAALVADGKSEILGVKYLDRGYSNLITNLKSLGANIDIYEMD